MALGCVQRWLLVWFPLLIYMGGFQLDLKHHKERKRGKFITIHFPGVSSITQSVSTTLCAFLSRVVKYIEQQIAVLTGNRFHQGNVHQF